MNSAVAGSTLANTSEAGAAIPPVAPPPKPKKGRPRKYVNGVTKQATKVSKVNKNEKNDKKAGGSSTVKKEKPKGERAQRARKPRVVKEKPNNAPEKINLDRQCGVALPQGGMCSRSLTCKTHSVGAKRQVPGRSQPYDVLVQLYQKRNQVKQSAQKHQRELDKLENEDKQDNEQPLTDDQEFEQVKAGVMRSCPLPLDRRVIMPVRFRTRFMRMRETLLGSINSLPAIPLTPGPIETTGSILGRAIVFDSANHQRSFTRPPRVGAYVEQLQQKQVMMQQRAIQQMQEHQQQQQQRRINNGN